MGFSVKILKDSINTAGCRLTTWELTYQRMVHAELMTHRLFSRNAASSRAIPIQKFIQQVLKDPAAPVWWGKNQSGMQAKEELSGWRKWAAQRVWFGSRYLAVAVAWCAWKVGLHKQIANRLLEPWMWITVIVSATDFGNWFHLRAHPDAQPEIRVLAEEMAFLYQHNTPEILAPGQWHLPLIGFPGDEDLSDEMKRKISVGRCARVSYLTHAGTRDVTADLALHNRLQEGSGNVGHWSPFEHVAQALSTDDWSGNFRGFRQYRKTFAREHHRELPWEVAAPA